MKSEDTASMDQLVTHSSLYTLVTFLSNECDCAVTITVSVVVIYNTNKVYRQH